MTEEWFRQKLESLKIKENRLTTLTEIHGRLKETPNLEIKVTNFLLSSPALYGCLDSGKLGSDSIKNCSARLDLVSDILSICMSKLTLVQSDFTRLLHRALVHKHPRLRVIALNAILEEVMKHLDDGNLNHAMSKDLVRNLLKAVQDPKTQVASVAVSILSLALADSLEQQFIKASFLEGLKQNAIIRCRLYALAANLAKRSATTLQQVEFVLDHALSELDNDEVLLQFNILEILANLAEQNHGLLYMEKRHVFDVIGRKLEEIEKNPIDRLLIPGIMKFFGKVSSVQPQKIITGNPHIILCLFECLHSGDISILPSAFDTLANLTHTQEGVLLLEHNYSLLLNNVFKDYSTYLRSLTTDLKNRAFCSLEHLFTFESPVSSEISSILQRWFNYLNNGSNNMQFIMEFCRNPFPDIKISALNLIRSLCLYSWGIDAIKNTAGFLEYLLDRKIEFDKEAKYAKFRIIKLLADSNAFDVHTNIQLTIYVNEGPYYMPRIIEIQVEGAD